MGMAKQIMTWRLYRNFILCCRSFPSRLPLTFGNLQGIQKSFAADAVNVPQGAYCPHGLPNFIILKKRVAEGVAPTRVNG
jgi:hypothetical protein